MTQEEYEREQREIQQLINQINAEGLYQKWVDEILLAK